MAIQSTDGLAGSICLTDETQALGITHHLRSAGIANKYAGRPLNTTEGYEHRRVPEGRPEGILEFPQVNQVITGASDEVC